MTRPVTDKQREVLAAVQKFWEVRGVAPSLADSSADLELSRATIHEHLQALKRKGQLEHIEGVGRSWRSTAAAPTSPSGPKRIPVVGAVAAGTPIFAQENINGWLTVDEAREQDTLFGLRIRGDSMTDAGILDGDVAIVRQQSTAEHGDIVVALVDDQDATVKKLERDAGTVRLVPMNSKYEPIVISPPRTLRVQGRVIGVRRDLDGGR